MRAQERGKRPQRPEHAKAPLPAAAPRALCPRVPMGPPAPLGPKPWRRPCARQSVLERSGECSSSGERAWRVGRPSPALAPPQPGSEPQFPHLQVRELLGNDHMKGTQGHRPPGLAPLISSLGPVQTIKIEKTKSAKAGSPWGPSPSYKGGT